MSVKERSATGASRSDETAETRRGARPSGGEDRRVRVDLRRASAHGTCRSARPTPHAADPSMAAGAIGADMGNQPGLSDSEREVLKVLWDRGPGTVREINEVLAARGRRWAYTTVATLLQRLAAKQYVAGDPSTVPHVYRARSRETSCWSAGSTTPPTSSATAAPPRSSWR